MLRNIVLLSFVFLIAVAPVSCNSTETATGDEDEQIATDSSNVISHQLTPPNTVGDPLPIGETLSYYPITGGLFEITCIESRIQESSDHLDISATIKIKVVEAIGNDGFYSELGDRLAVTKNEETYDLTPLVSMKSKTYIDIPPGNDDLYECVEIRAKILKYFLFENQYETVVLVWEPGDMDSVYYFCIGMLEDYIVSDNITNPYPYPYTGVY